MAKLLTTSHVADGVLRFAKEADGAIGRWVAQTQTDRDGIGSAEGLEVGDRCWVIADNAFFVCTGVTGPSSSTWTAIALVGPIGNMAFTGNLGGVVTTIPAQNTFVRVGNGQPGHPLYVANANNERFSLQGAQTQLQELRYDDVVAKKLCVFGSMSIQEPALGAEGFSLRLTQNGAPIANAEAQGQTGGLITSAGSITTHGIVTANPTDVFTMELANNTSAANLVVSSAQLTIE